MKKIIIANWKMQLDLSASLSLARTFAKQIRRGNREVAIAPSYLALPEVAKMIKGKLSLAAQDSAPQSRGAYTGEVSPHDLYKLGARYVILGHSERRGFLGEDNALVSQKAVAAINSGLVPLVCVGESLAEKLAGQSRIVVAKKLRRSLRDVKIKKASQLIVAYEPIWAISTSRQAKAMTPVDADRMHQYIKSLLKKMYRLDIAVIYGGSADAKNAALFLAQKNIGGLLVGGASLKKDFINVCRL